MTPSSRQRLMDGLARSVEHKGFAATTIADIVREAEVSKRTFYEEFPDKNACFLALYRDVGAAVVLALARAAAPDAAWAERGQNVLKAYVKALRKRPELTRAFFLELNAAGPLAIGARREVLEGFAAFIRDLVAQSRTRLQPLKELSPAMALAFVAGINELVLLAIERHRFANLQEVESTALELLLGLTSA